MKVCAYPIYALATGWQGPAFKYSLLPLRITDKVTLEDFSPYLHPDTFRGLDALYSKRQIESLKSLRYALVLRIDESVNAPDSALLEEHLVQIMACLRLIRPTREELGPLKGNLTAKGLELTELSNPFELHTLSEPEKLAAVTTEDVKRLQQIASTMLLAMNGECWKFRMAVHFFTDGYFMHANHKSRFFLRCTALEALFSSKRHRGSAVLKARVLAFLGEHIQFYESSELPVLAPQSPAVRLPQVLAELSKARNTIAHGDKLDGSFFTEPWREGVNGPIMKLQVLDEAVTSLVRQSLLKILEDNLLEHFRSSDTADSYFQTVDESINNRRSH